MIEGKLGGGRFGKERRGEGGFPGEKRKREGERREKRRETGGLEAPGETVHDTIVWHRLLLGLC